MPLFRLGYLSEVSFTWLDRPRAVLNVLLWRISLATTNTLPLTATAISELVEMFQLVVLVNLSLHVCTECSTTS